MGADKVDIRKKILEKRRKMKKTEVKEKSKKIIEKLKKTKEFKNAKTVMLYISHDNEVFTHDLIKKSLKDKTIVVPFITNEEMMISTIDSFNKLRPGTYDILEPINIKYIFRENLDLILIPGIAFDKKGNRIGYGIGYYDIFLKGIDCPKFGLAFKLQIVKEIKAEKHDVKLDKIITE